jgi:hypothetical protein
MQMKNSKKLVAFLIVFSITVYGAWCLWDYFSLIRVGRLDGIWSGIISPRFSAIPLYIVPIIGIWMGWSGLLNNVNAGQDWDRSVGYMKIIGGAALIIITNLFLYVLAR